MKKILVFTFCILLSGIDAYAVDVLDVFKFTRDTVIQFQDGTKVFDPSRSHGVVSPLTAYVGREVEKLESAKNIEEVYSEAVEIKEGDFLLEYVNPSKIADIQDEVVRRNYVGLKEFWKIAAGIEDVFAAATDYENFEKIFPGIRESEIVEKKGNMTIHQSWRKTDASIFGKRKTYFRSSNIFSPNNRSDRRIIKCQLINADGGSKKNQALVYFDSLWYFEKCGENCTLVYYLGFSLLHWDYDKTPPLFPFAAKEVRRQLVSGVLEGSAKSSIALMVKFEDPRFRSRQVKDLDDDDKEIISDEVDRRLKSLREAGRIKIDLNGNSH